MIDDKKIEAQINRKLSMIAFIEADEGDDEKELLPIVSQLEQQNMEILKMMKRVESSDKEVKKSVEFLRKLIFESKDEGIHGDKEDYMDI